MDELRFWTEYQAAWSAQLDGRADEAEDRFRTAKAVAAGIDGQRLAALIVQCRERLEERVGVTLPGSFR